MWKWSYLIYQFAKVWVHHVCKAILAVMSNVMPAKLNTSWAHAARPAGSIVTLQLSCLSVWLSICHSLGRPVNESMAWQLARMAGSVCSPPRCKRKPSDTSTIDNRGTVPLAQAQYHEWSMWILRNRQLNCLGQEFVTILTLCPISELHDPVDSYQPGHLVLLHAWGLVRVEYWLVFRRLMSDLFFQLQYGVLYFW